MELLHELLQLDHAVSEHAAGYRSVPATAFFALASAWWIKGPLFVVAGLLKDFHDRRILPLTAAAVGLALLLGDFLSGTIKEAVDRPRPPRADPGFEAAVSLPASPSFPSGHATTTFACAVAIAVLVPRWRWPALAIAATVAVARVYLGVHYSIDVVAGAALGTVVGLALALTFKRLRQPAASPQPAN